MPTAGGFSGLSPEEWEAQLTGSMAKSKGCRRTGGAEAGMVDVDENTLVTTSDEDLADIRRGMKECATLPTFTAQPVPLTPTL